MKNWYQNRTLLNISIILMVATFIAYFFWEWQWGLPLFLAIGAAIMIRGIVKITIRMRANRTR